ncbi:S8 family serine peptidase [Planotetraspora sp. GP83]|uniref:S8 family serine peptidase n=1 Tax=Planotetraspora sp. GP83 TaxID=3156264 RepID=UPI003515F4D3
MNWPRPEPEGARPGRHARGAGDQAVGQCRPRHGVRGPPVEFFAHGSNVEVAWPGGRLSRCTGNSFATPHVAGLCALILGKHPGLTAFQLKNVLYLTAFNVKSGQ